MPKETYICPSCDSEVEIGGSCPVCGPAPTKRRKKRKTAAVPRKSWEQDESMDGLGLPDDEFDYDEFVEREFGTTPHRRVGIKWYWWVTAVVLVLWMAWIFI